MGKRELANAPTGKADEHANVQGDMDKLAAFWQEEVCQARNRMNPWYTRGLDVVQSYRGANDDDNEYFAMLWANTETLKPAVYSACPKPEVTRRFLERDAIGNIMATLVERTIAYCMDIVDKEFDEVMERCVEDFLLPGRATARVIYDAVIPEVNKKRTIYDPELERDVEEDYKEDEKQSEEVYAEYVYWQDFCHSDGIQWKNVWWTGFASNLTRSELIKAFGKEKGNDIPLNGRIPQDKYNEWVDSFGNATGEGTNQGWRVGLDAGWFNGAGWEEYARVWEIWDKRERKVIVVSEGYHKIIEEKDDPYELEGFFPCPPPLYSVKTTGSLEPVPEYTLYQFQAEELNILTRRINKLTDALKARGVCDPDIEALTKLFDGEENDIIPDEDFGKLVSAGGIDGAVVFAPIGIFGDVLSKLVDLRREAINVIYEITGISDIIRGFSDPRESATAQKLKGRYGSMRVEKRQKKVQKFARRLVRLMGEVATNLFDVETMAVMSGLDQREDVMKGLQAVEERMSDSSLRDFTIDIETDSTIAVDEAQQQEDTAMFFTAIAELMQQLIPAAEAGIMPMEAAKEMLLFAARRFNAGRELESSLEAIGTEQKQEEPDPAAVAAQQKAELEMQKLELEKNKVQMEAIVEMEKIKLEYSKLGQDAEMHEADNALKVVLEEMNQETVRINARGGDN